MSDEKKKEIMTNEEFHADCKARIRECEEQIAAKESGLIWILLTMTGILQEALDMGFETVKSVSQSVAYCGVTYAAPNGWGKWLLAYRNLEGIAPEQWESYIKQTLRGPVNPTTFIQLFAHARAKDVEPEAFRGAVEKVTKASGWIKKDAAGMDKYKVDSRKRLDHVIAALEKAGVKSQTGWTAPASPMRKCTFPGTEFSQEEMEEILNADPEIAAASIETAKVNVLGAFEDWLADKRAIQDGLRAMAGKDADEKESAFKAAYEASMADYEEEPEPEPETAMA